MGASRHARSAALLVLALLCGIGAELRAQAGASTMAVAPRIASRQFETRAELEARAQAAEREQRTSEAWLLRSRLQKGDFQEGDRIVVVIEASSAASDTMQVRAGNVLQFPQMGALALTGVLRSELTDAVRNHLATYLTTRNVRATPLLPIAVLGMVQQPGYYYLPADIVLRDVIMRAGGPSGSSDLSKVVIRRGGQVIWTSQDVSAALSDGLSLDALHLRAGDEVWVPERQRRFQLTTLATVISTTLAATLAIVQIAR